METQRDTIQKDLDKLAKWADTWQMTFNASKCKVMHLGHGNPKIEYTLNGLPLSKLVPSLKSHSSVEEAFT